MRAFSKSRELDARSFCQGDEYARPYPVAQLRKLWRPTLWQRFVSWLNQEAF